MIYLKIENGEVVNVAIFANLPQGWMEAPEGVGIGWLWDGDNFSLPVISIDELRASRLTELDNLFHAKVNQSILWNGVFTLTFTKNMMHKTRNQGSRAVRSIIAGQSKTFKVRFDEGVEVLTDADMVELVDLIDDMGENHDDVYDAHFDAITGEQNRAMLENYDMTQGW